jgi:hypothetical protein
MTLELEVPSSQRLATDFVLDMRKANIGEILAILRRICARFAIAKTRSLLSEDPNAPMKSSETSHRNLDLKVFIQR